MKVRFSKEALKILRKQQKSKTLCFDPMIGYWQQEGNIPQPSDDHLCWKQRSHHEKEQQDENI